MDLYPSLRHPFVPLDSPHPRIIECENATLRDLIDCKQNLFNHLDFPMEAFRYFLWLSLIAYR